MITAAERSASSTSSSRAPRRAVPACRAYADLLEVVGALRATPAPEPDPAFVAALRERLMAEAETVLTAAAAERGRRRRPAPAAPGRRRAVRRRNRRLAAVVSGVILVGATATMAVAAQSALPGRARSTRSSAASRAPTPS